MMSLITILMIAAARVFVRLRPKRFGNSIDCELHARAVARTVVPRSSVADPGLCRFPR
jgi:hypothetical protein